MAVRQRVLSGLSALGLTVFVAAAVPAQTPTTGAPPARSSKPAKAAKTAWGDPDLQGIWTGSTITPLERPKQFADKAFLTDDEVAEAAKYFSGLNLASFVKVEEADTAPKTIVAEGLLAKAPDGGTEPLGRRIVEVPEDLERVKNRDPRTPYIAYVPKGSLDKGKAFVTGGATPCISCHGPDLHGIGDIPHIGGRSPTYIVRQLYDIKTGKRGGNIAPMQGVVSALELEDMIAIAAYVASQEP